MWNVERWGLEPGETMWRKLSGLLSLKKSGVFWAVTRGLILWFDGFAGQRIIDRWCGIIPSIEAQKSKIIASAAACVITPFNERTNNAETISERTQNQNKQKAGHAHFATYNLHPPSSPINPPLLSCSPPTSKQENKKLCDSAHNHLCDAGLLRSYSRLQRHSALGRVC